MKQCSRCKETKSISNFPSNKSRKDGLSVYCRECQRQYTASHYKRNSSDYKKRALARNYQQLLELQAIVFRLKEAPCMDCGRTYHPVQMDFDHRDVREKMYNVSHIHLSGRGVQTLLAEVKKCDVVCASCHRLRSQNRAWNRHKGIQAYLDENRDRIETLLRSHALIA